jgi:hypothetical protein
VCGVVLEEKTEAPSSRGHFVARGALRVLVLGDWNAWRCRLLWPMQPNSWFFCGSRLGCLRPTKTLVGRSPLTSRGEEISAEVKLALVA